MSNLSLHTNSFGRETSTQMKTTPSATPLAVANWRTKKHIQAESTEFKERAGRLGVPEQQVLTSYAGDTTKTRTVVLEKMESYRQQNNNQQPIVARDSQGPAGGANTEWICNICSERFSTFQKVAIHLTSNEWSLPSWPCPVKLCCRSYKALDQLRRHMNNNHSNASTSTEIATPPELTPSPQRRTITADESQLQPHPFTGPPDGHRQVARPFIPNYAGSQVQSTNQPRHQFQPQASPVFNQQPQQLFPPALNQSFGNNIPNPSWHGTSGSMNTWPPSAIDVGQQFPSTEDTQHVQTNVNYFPTNQYLPQNNRNQYGAATPWYDEFRQLGSGSSLPSNTFNGFAKYPVPLTRSKSDSSLETEMRRQTPRAFPSSASLAGQDYVGLGENLLSRTQSLQQPPRDIPQFQPRAPPMFDQLVGLPTQPSTSPFSTDGMPHLNHTNWPSTSSCMNLPSRNVTNAGRQIQPTRSALYGPTTADYLLSQLSANDMDQGAGAHKPAADTQFQSNSSLASNDPSHFMDNMRSHNHSQGYHTQEGLVHGQPSRVNPPSLEEELMALFKFDEGFPDP